MGARKASENLDRAGVEPFRASPRPVVRAVILPQRPQK